MIKFGADFNYFEFKHVDLLQSNKINIDNICVEIKNELSKELKNKKELSKNLGLRESLLKPMKKQKKDMFYDIIKIKEQGRLDYLGNISQYSVDTINIYNDISEKIKIDHIIRPLRIFWIKVDFKLLNQIFTLILGGVLMYAKIVINDFKNLFVKIN